MTASAKTGAPGTPTRRGGAIAATVAAVALVLGSRASSAQTLPDQPSQLQGLFNVIGGLIQPPLQQVGGLLSQTTSQLLAAAPVVGPFYSTYARGDFEPPVAIDTNPDPDVVEVTLVAIPAFWEFVPGVPTLVWTFNGTIPGPTIEAKVGDEVVVHYVNLVDTPGGIHWHGVEVPATMDGSHVSGPSIPRGGSFDYRFKANRPSLFWYHPHHDASQQVERGLYGALLVHDPVADQALPANERILVLDDVMLDGDGQFSTFEPAAGPERAAYQVNGREGNVLLVNGRAGRVLPVENGVPLRLRMVDVANSRFMRVNVPGRSLFLIGTDGGLLEAPQEHTPIQTVVDPDPLHYGAQVSDNVENHGVLLTPGERADVVVTPAGNSGDLVPVEWHDWGRGRHFYYNKCDPDGSNCSIVLYHVHSAYPSFAPEKLFDLQLAGDPQTPAYTLPASLRTIPQLTPGSTVLQLTLNHGTPDAQGNVSFWMQQDDSTNPPTPQPYPVVGESNVNHATVGDTVLWEVTNAAHGEHNFHTHGFDFQPLSMDYYTCDSTLHTSEFVKTETFDVRQEKDTIRLPGPPMPACSLDSGGKLVCPMCDPGTAYTRLRAVARLDHRKPDGSLEDEDIQAYGKNYCVDPATCSEVHSGGWMVHCHILEHAAGGMMTYLSLKNP